MKKNDTSEEVVLVNVVTDYDKDGNVIRVAKNYYSPADKAAQLKAIEEGAMSAEGADILNRIVAMKDKVTADYNGRMAQLSALYDKAADSLLKGGNAHG